MDKKSRRLTPARAAIAGLALTALPMASFAFVSVGVSITVAPPALPVYVQPPCPAVGYIWTPGYWAYGDGDYYWVPGTWVTAPSPGLLWTPGYWGWGNGLYAWHEGYWGPHVGFYGGVNYGYGYGGVGFEGGYWRGGAFYYNRSVANLGGIHVTNVYNRTVINNVNVTRVSFNGGDGGVRARPNPHELAAGRDRHVAFTSMQRQQEHAAFGNHDLRASVNQGRPRIAATQRPGAFTGHGVVAARAGEWHGGGDHGTPGRGPEGRPGADHGGSGRDAGDRGGPGRGPDARAAERGGPGHGGPDHVANRSDRPPGAGGSPDVRSGAGGGPEAGRPGAGGRGADNRGGPGAAGRGSDNRGAPGAGASSAPRLSPSAGGNAGAPRGPQSRANQGNEIHNRAPAPRAGGSPQPSPQQISGGGQPPRQQAAPHVQSAPRPEARRSGGEPHGQGGRPQGPNERGGEHGRR